jgi:hypothetical protein
LVFRCWKEPCDQGIISALMTRYKLLYIRDVLCCAVLCFHDPPEYKKRILQTLGTHLVSGSASIENGNPAHLMDAAKYIKEAWESVFQFQLNIASEKLTY